MLVDRNVARFLSFDEDSVLTALNRISANKAGFVVVVSGSGRALGVVTDGDIRRWLTDAPSIDLEASVGGIANKNFVSASLSSPPSDVAGLFSDRVRAIPLLDEIGRLAAIAFPRPGILQIGQHKIGEGHPTIVIAEIGNNHNGDVALAKRLVELAHEAGADLAKFQLRDLTRLYGEASSSDANQDLGAQYTLDLLARFNLSVDALFEVLDYTRSLGMVPFCTPWDLPSLQALERYGCLAYKVASADLTNHEFIRQLAATGKPLILSTGMSHEQEIKETVAILRDSGAQYCLLHCNSTYPAPYRDVNLRYMDRLKELGDCPVGYSGHERGWSVPIAAVARGALVIEKHFTIDRGMEGNDHKVSLLPDEFAAMVAGIRAVEESLGAAGPRVMTQGEMMNREVLAKSVVAAIDLSEGTLIQAHMLKVQSPGQGLSPNRLDELIGKVVRRDISTGSPFYPSDLEDEIAKPRNYEFARPWGLPVRWHDYKSLLDKTNLDLLEYHLSYNDMSVRLEDWFSVPMDVDFVVHAPELFAGDHILDLASSDPEYRARSISELQRVISLTRQLRQYHARSSTPLIVVNMGGFTTAKPLPVEERAERYQLVSDALRQLDREGVELIPQTMPPFPWHFGGQSFHNLFIDPAEISDFCARESMRICLDVSHSQLACNHSKWSMHAFCEAVGPYTAHLHIVDAKGVDGEGLQIGDGGIDFDGLAAVLMETCPDASFVPEIWQGHKDGGAGFWRALERLEPSFGRVAQIARA